MSLDYRYRMGIMSKICNHMDDGFAGSVNGTPCVNPSFGLRGSWLFPFSLVSSQCVVLNTFSQSASLTALVDPHIPGNTLTARPFRRPCDSPRPACQYEINCQHIKGDYINTAVRLEGRRAEVRALFFLLVASSVSLLRCPVLWGLPVSLVSPAPHPCLSRCFFDAESRA
jgi:hypothetical protein